MGDLAVLLAIITKYIFGIVISLIFTYVFWKVWEGNRNKWVLLNSAITLFSAAFMFLLAVGVTKFTLKG